MVRENINSLKNIKNNLYNVKKDNNSLSFDLKKLKEEYVNKSNKRVKARSIFINIKANRFNKMFDRFNMRFNDFINKSSLKANACAIKDSAIVKNNVVACTSKNDLIVKNYADACTSTDNDNEEDNEESHEISPSELFSNNLTKIIGLVDELENDDIYDDDEWLVIAQSNKINPLLDELIDHVWLIIYNKNREKNEIINIDIDKDKDNGGYVKIYKKIIDDKFEFVNRIVELYNNAIEKKEFNNLKDDVLKLIDNSCICDVERKGCKKDNNNKKDSGVKRKGRKKDNSKNVNINDDKDNDNDNDKDKDKDKDNSIDKLLNNKDKLHNFSDKVLNNLTNIAKLKEQILINKKKGRRNKYTYKGYKIKT